MKSIIISGICGKTGANVYESAKEAGLNVACGIDREYYGNFDCPVYQSFADVNEYADVVVDFSSPSNLTGLLQYCVENKTPAVIATTGYSAEEEIKIAEAASIIPILKASNLSLGVNFFAKIVGETAEVLDEYDVEIIERHHRYKKDAPSGTTKMIVEAIKKSRAISLLSYGRKGEKPRKDGEIGIHSVRGGSVVGEHEVCFYGKYDEIRLIHSAQNKKLFSDGAIKAALFIAEQQPGFYTEKDLYNF